MRNANSQAKAIRLRAELETCTTAAVSRGVAESIIAAERQMTELAE